MNATTTKTVNRNATSKAGAAAASTKAPTKRKPAADKQEQAGGPLSDAMEKAKGHLGGAQTAGDAGQQQGEGTSGKDTAAKPARRKAADKSAGQSTGGDGGGGSVDNGAGSGGMQQGTGTEGVRMGTLQVLVVDRVIPGRGGKTVSTEEKYPFNAIGFATKLGDGSMKGPSFFIPRSANPDGAVAAGRKRLRGQPVAVITRKVTEEEATEWGLGNEAGVLIWKIEGAGK